jgi:hypothetical protein
LMVVMRCPLVCIFEHGAIAPAHRLARHQICRLLLRSHPS